jgi:regulator of sigma E protease
MSYVLAFVGFAALIILHEAGHFVAAKTVGMYVERFSLFFPPTIASFRRGDTEYCLGSIPLGGYVKIAGMSPREELPREVEPRAYFNQPVWKRIVVVSAGPIVNLLIAFVIVWGLFLSRGESVATTRVATVSAATPAAGVLRTGDEIVSVDGVRSPISAMQRQIASHRCSGVQTSGCQAATPARFVVRREGRVRVRDIRPRYVAKDNRMEIGFSFAQAQKEVSAGRAASLAVRGLWTVTKATLSAVVRIFEPRERKQLHGVLGGYTAVQRSFGQSSALALEVLAMISLSLGIFNLFPFLPLDGGHIFWALAEGITGRRVPYEVMERASAVGFVLLLVVFVIGLVNDISTLNGSGLGLR